MIAGNFKTYQVTIANGATGTLDLSTVVSTEKILKINPGASNVRLLLTSMASTTNADVEDYLLVNEENEFEIGRGLDRLSFYNGSGSEVKVSIAVLY